MDDIDIQDIWAPTNVVAQCQLCGEDAPLWEVVWVDTTRLYEELDGPLHPNVVNRFSPFHPDCVPDILEEFHS
jgi:hypothetical protein